MALQSDCIILGGGAAALASAAALGAGGLRVTVLEKLDRVGKKLLATGNGRCNLSNTDMNPSYYGEAAPFVARVYEATPPDEVGAFFSRLGLMTAVEDGRVYPRTMAAASVLDVLRLGCERTHVSLLTGREVVGLTPSRRGGWSVQTADGEGFFAPAVLCAMGGSAAPHLGTDGAGARLMERLGHAVTPQYPALVQLRSPHPALRALKGIRTRAALTLMIDDRPHARETGELLFADYGVSGVCVFQLSRHVERALKEKRRVSLLVNLLPEVPDARIWLAARVAALPGSSAQALFTGVFPRLLAQTVLRQAGIAADDPAASLTPQSRDALAQAVAAFPLTITGTQGFSHAQVTAGGVSTDDIHPQTMASRLYGGLYLAGEILDVDGPCGGYNLHFAFAGALTAAKAIQNQLGV